MFIVKLKDKTKEDLLKWGVPEWIEVDVEKFETLKDSAKFCKRMNDHIKKFHEERIGKHIYFIKEIK